MHGLCGGRLGRACEGLPSAQTTVPAITRAEQLCTVADRAHFPTQTGVALRGTNLKNSGLGCHHQALRADPLCEWSAHEGEVGRPRRVLVDGVSHDCEW